MLTTNVSLTEPQKRKLELTQAHVCYACMKMNSVNGGLFAIDSGPNTWQHTILTFRYRPLKKTMTAAWIFINCGVAISVLLQVEVSD